ncbi:MAG: tetratricopeptide repeat protein, partial [Azoarcus sp.]|jgi:hypothetical protein|nr:tetratricopeptide repeat protein [Azoarcus sp.]
LVIREKALGKDHPSTAMIHNDIAVVLDSQDDYAGALAGCFDAYRVFFRKLGGDHPNTRAIAANMAHVYLKTDDPRPFEAWLEEQMGKAPPG